jgi:predicted metal-dependent phosphoesterase TrpH
MTILDMHIHIRYRSRCSNLSIDDLYNNLSEKFDGICITDHWRLKPLINHPFQERKVFVGVEITCNKGDLLAYGIKSTPIRNKHIDAQKIIDSIHKQGGIAVCAHPFSNRHQGFGDYVYDHDFDAIEINGALDKKFKDMAKKVAIIMDLPTIGGSDAHTISQLNSVGTKFKKPINSIEDIVNAVKNKDCKAIKI